MKNKKYNFLFLGGIKGLINDDANIIETKFITTKQKNSITKSKIKIERLITENRDLWSN